MAILSKAFGRRAEQRFTAKTADLAHWREIYPWLESVAGERVTPATAMGLATYFACVRNIAEDEGKLPVDVFRKRGQDRIPVDHELDYLLNVAPNDDMTAIDFRTTLTAHAAGIGNGYAQIVFDGRMRPQALWPLEPTRMLPKRENGRLFYEYRLDTKTKVLMDSDVLHLRGISDEGVVGYSIPTLGRQVLGAALASQKFVGAFFGNGAWPGGVLEHPAKLGEQAHKNLQQSIEGRHGGADAAHRLMILEEGMKYTALAVAPENAQLVEQMMFGVEEVCRYFRMPPHKVQHLLRATFSNIEHQDLEYVGDTLMPWLIRWEQECKRKLFSRSVDSALFVRHNVTAQLRADAPSRAAYYSTMRQNAVYNVNEIRALEDMNGIGPAGDLYYHQLNMTELGKEPEAATTAEPAPPASPDDETDDEAERARALSLIEAQRPALADAYARVLRVETDKAERARKRGELAVWAANFYPGHQGHVAEVLAPTLASLRAAVLVTGTQLGDTGEAANELAARHVARSMQDIAGQALGGWSDARAVAAADDAIHYLSEQLGGTAHAGAHA